MINKKIIDFTKGEIINQAKLLQPKHIAFLFRLYDHKNKYNKNICNLVDNLDFETLNNILNQIEKTNGTNADSES